jgi:hypothetical protein
VRHAIERDSVRNRKLGILGSHSIAAKGNVQIRRCRALAVASGDREQASLSCRITDCDGTATDRDWGRANGTT